MKCVDLTGKLLRLDRTRSATRAVFHTSGLDRLRKRIRRVAFPIRPEYRDEVLALLCMIGTERNIHLDWWSDLNSGLWAWGCSPHEGSPYNGQETWTNNQPRAIVANAPLLTDNDLDFRSPDDLIRGTTWSGYDADILALYSGTEWLVNPLAVKRVAHCATGGTK